MALHDLPSLPRLAGGYWKRIPLGHEGRWDESTAEAPAMPHCILEASDNLLDQPDWRGLLREINRTLAATGLFAEADIKSRYFEHRTFVIGDGALERAFVALDVRILAGRADEVKAQLSETLLEVLARAFPRTLAETACSLTVQITDIHRPSYRRRISHSN